MRGLIFSLFLFYSVVSWSCIQPSSSELFDFFEGSSQWTEVKNRKSFKIAEKRPVELKIPFTNLKDTSIRWGSNSIRGEGLSICWSNSNKEAITIRKNFFRTTLVKVEKGLLKSWIPIDGDLYYRKDSEVKR